jgi:hypothetical protein
MQVKKLLRALGIFLICQPAINFAADTVNYNHPKYRGYALDWCRVFEHDCGKGAADAYCRAKGHLKAASWAKRNHPGVKTMTIGQNSICDPNNHRCDTFSSIECVTKGQKTFVKPIHRGYRLDWCRVFEHDCGDGAARAYCQAKGYNKLISFKKTDHPGVKTMTIGQNSICDPQYHRCDSFSWIKCGQ